MQLISCPKTARIALSPSDGTKQNGSHPGCVCPLQRHPSAAIFPALFASTLVLYSSPRMTMRSARRVNIANSTPVCAVKAAISFILTAVLCTIVTLSYADSACNKRICRLFSGLSKCSIAWGLPLPVLRCSIGFPICIRSSPLLYCTHNRPFRQHTLAFNWPHLKTNHEFSPPPPPRN